MLRLRSLLTTLALLALCLTLTAAAAKTADPAAAKLEEKGLKKVGPVYVLPVDEQVLLDGMKQVREAKKKVDAELKERKKIERVINKVKGALGNAEFERRKLNEKLANTKDVLSHNQIVGKINSLTSQMEEALEYKAEQEKKLKNLGTARTDYVNQVIDLHKKMEEVEAKYGELAADNEVSAALATAKPKAKLGPSTGFIANSTQLDKMRSEISSETIKVTMENEIPWLDVTLNGTTRTMVFDSGASSVCIPFDMAKAMELVPPADAPTVRMQLADGKVVEGKMMLLKSVRVGIFEVKDVECAVLPEELVAAQPLLGGSFLRNFIYKLDPDAGELHLSRLGAAEVTSGPGAKKPAGKGGDAEEMKKE